MSDTAKTAKTAKPTVAKKAEPQLTGKEKAALRRADLAKILAFAKEQAEKTQNTEIVALVAKYVPRGPKTDEPRWTITLRRLFKDQSTRHEDELWREEKIGRGEMRALIKDAVVREKPESRMWVIFDLPTCTYRLLGTGKDKPAKWPDSSPLPKDMKR